MSTYSASADHPGPGMEGSIAIFILTKYKPSLHDIEDKPATPEILAPFPMTKVKIPSSVETTLKLS